MNLPTSSKPRLPTPCHWWARWSVLLFFSVNLVIGATHTLRRADLVVTIETEPAGYMEAFGPRFDHTAAVRQILLQGQSLLGEWGLPDEFGIKGLGVLGYDEAAAGADFIKIGLGRLNKDKAAPYDFSSRYPIKALYPVITNVTADSIHVVQSSDNVLPWGYHYEKTYRLLGDETLEISYALTNTGATIWSFEHYNHHWFVLGAKPVAPAYTLETGFPKPEGGTDFVHTGRELRISRTLSAKDYVYASGDLPGTAATSNHFVLSSPGQPKVAYRGHFPPARFAVYVESRGFCPEIFFRAELVPAQTVRWSAHYKFLPPETPSHP